MKDETRSVNKAGRTLSEKTVIPIGVAISVIVGVVSGYVTFSKMTSDLRERVTSLDGRMQGMENMTQEVLKALDDAAKDMYRRRVNILSLLEVELGRLESHLTSWNAPELSAARALQGKPDAYQSFPAGYPPITISQIALDNAIRGLPNTDLVLALDALANELAEFNTLITNSGGTPMFGMPPRDPMTAPRLLPGASDQLYSTAVSKCVAKRDAMLILVKRLREQVNTVRAEAKANAKTSP